MIGKMEMDGEYVICPGCGHKQGDCWEWVTDRIENDNCPNCGSFLAFWAEHDVTYYTQLVLPPRDSDGSPKGGDACGSVEDDSAGPKDIAHPQDPSPTKPRSR